jgi:hypothetical protein
MHGGAKFVLRPRRTNTLALGQIFTVIDNSAATPIVGAFHNLAEGKILIVNGVSCKPVTPLAMGMISH